jgi:hypothetical protein
MVAPSIILVYGSVGVHPLPVTAYMPPKRLETPALDVAVEALEHATLLLLGFVRSHSFGGG